MAEHEVSRFGHVEVEDLPPDLAERIGAIAEKSGFVPNVFRALGRRPRELRAFLDYHDALMEPDRASGDGGLTKAEREMIAVVVSSLNRCHYCLTSHGATLRRLQFDDAERSLGVQGDIQRQRAAARPARLDL